jgi:tetratricopeptide (TPR) repeat protein
VVSVCVPEPGSGADKQVSSTSCARCRARILTVTHRDGTVQLAPWSPDDAPTGPLVAASTSSTAFGLSEIMRFPFALWQPRGEQVGVFEHRPEWAQALREALREAQDRPRPLSVPRRIFVSYRWGTPAEDAWVDALRRQLEARGNAVELDRKAEREAQPPSVPELVARIAGCHVFLAVLDSGYIERVAPTKSRPRAEGWVTDEFHTALAFASRGLLVLLGLLRQGDRLPAAFRLFAPGEAGNTFDVRDPGSLEVSLDRLFVQFGVAPQAEAARSAAVALHESRQALAAGDVETALAEADRACELVPDLADGFAQRARVGYQAGRAAQVLHDAQRAFGIDPTLDEMLIHAAASACDLGRWSETARAARLALERNRDDANAHYLVGEALNEMDQLEPALAHFQVAHDLGLDLVALYNDAGSASRRAGRPAQGLEWCRLGLEKAPGDPALLANATAAAIEAGRPAEAYASLNLLAQENPDSGEVAVLATTLARWCQEEEGTPPPVLSRRVAPILDARTVACTVCAARIQLADDRQLLCGGCGAVLPPSIEPCACCGGAGKVAPALQRSSCPFCRKGTLRPAPRA